MNNQDNQDNQDNQNNQDTYLNNIIDYAIKEVSNGNVKLHKQYLNEIIYYIKHKNLYQLKEFEINSYYIPEKKYYTEIISRLKNIKF
jgi:hypothetical protein